MYQAHSFHLKFITMRLDIQGSLKMIDYTLSVFGMRNIFYFVIFVNCIYEIIIDGIS